MTVCTSCKNKTSLERCTNKALANFTMCKMHVKSKNPRVWSTVNNIDPKVLMIQRIWRGHRIRRWIKLGGPGATEPKIRHNTEDMCTMEENVHPLEYFGFEEDTKVYWFDIRTFLQYMNTAKQLVNPYTRKELTLETRKRARTLYVLRRIHKLPVVCDVQPNRSIVDVTTNLWRVVSHIIEENGFSDINPLLFESLNNVQLFILTTMISNDIKAWAAEHKSIQSQRWKYFNWSSKLTKFVYENDRESISYSTAKVLSTILYDSVEPYSVCFIIISAMFRL